ncbi:MAG TPA: competence type IV pilus major pilin ComGC [Tetragenococcus sp.]|nr:competence type IV pilus major pilin ComGC [Tetragenococcus sp.]
MKKILKKIQLKNKKAFTLIEMMIVLLIISILVLLFIPNLAKQKDSVASQGDKAIVKVVENQKELYEIETGEKISDSNLDLLVSSGYLTETQVSQYRKAKK